MHRTELAVRDYECDIQGIVNNAVYLNYLETARHEFLKDHGINFIEMHKKGKDLVVIRAEIDYKKSLKADDKFYITTSLKAISKLKFAFDQEIYRNDDVLSIKALITGTCISSAGKPIIAEELSQFMAK